VTGAMAQKVVLVCDMEPGCRGEIRTWMVTHPATGHAKTVDLCDTHAAPLEHAYEQGSRPAAVRSAQRRVKQTARLKSTTT
jgi:hypothetical protein